MWDSPSVEVTRMKQECEQIVSEYEDDLEEWYLNIRPPSGPDIRSSLEKFLCVDRVLRHSSKKCLWESAEKKNFKGDKEDL